MHGGSLTLVILGALTVTLGLIRYLATVRRDQLPKIALYILALWDRYLGALRRLLSRLRVIRHSESVAPVVDPIASSQAVSVRPNTSKDASRSSPHLRGSPRIPGDRVDGSPSARVLDLEATTSISAPSTPPEEFPIILGDYLFDIRSALDHLVAAIVPRKYRGTIEFPIFSRTRSPATKRAGTTWTLKKPPEGGTRDDERPARATASQALKLLQPYDASGRLGQVSPVQHPLSLLKDPPERRQAPRTRRRRNRPQQNQAGQPTARPTTSSRCSRTAQKLCVHQRKWT